MLLQNAKRGWIWWYVSSFSLKLSAFSQAHLRLGAQKVPRKVQFNSLLCLISKDKGHVWIRFFLDYQSEKITPNRLIFSCFRRPPLRMCAGFCTATRELWNAGEISIFVTPTRLLGQRKQTRPKEHWYHGDINSLGSCSSDTLNLSLLLVMETRKAPTWRWHVVLLYAFWHISFFCCCRQRNIVKRHICCDPHFYVALLFLFFRRCFGTSSVANICTVEYAKISKILPRG
jgi:hypothetical protein